ncbi:MAG: hypothetical protein U5J97_01725 [Trueperaceae bacterium]|nr:hypothetical protein [Trueperaceae bacterium]
MSPFDLQATRHHRHRRTGLAVEQVQQQRVAGADPQVGRVGGAFVHADLAVTDLVPQRSLDVVLDDRVDAACGLGVQELG